MPKEALKADAKKAETTSDDVALVSIKFEGQTFTIPRDGDEWPIRAELARIKAAETGLYTSHLTWLEEVLGPEQWAKALEVAPKRGDFFRLLGVVATAIREECRF